jgi:serine/threonine-protein kinase RsbT
MQVLSSETLPIRIETDVIKCRQMTKVKAIELRFSVLDQTKMVTAASEIARNTLIYGRGGDAVFETLSNAGRRGLRLRFVDRGPGIADLALALTDGYTSGGGLGLGLSGSKRLVNEFDVVSAAGQGTTVTLTRWA